MSRPIRIAGCSGSATDRRDALTKLASNASEDPIDVITGDWMSEYNMSARGVSKTENPDQDAFEPTFIESLEPALLHLAKHKVRLVVNAGASDTQKLHGIVTWMVEDANLDLKVAWIEGDEVMPIVRDALEGKTSELENIYTGETLANWKFEPIYAQAYLGGIGIAMSLVNGADIVVCGRVSDASPVLGASLWWHSWDMHNFNLLANALVAGHLIECSSYVTGGNFTGFKRLESSWQNIGYPIAEISSSGQVIITKNKGSGGEVSIDTCTAQLLYEIQGPLYLNSDVTADLTNTTFTHLSTDRIALHGVTGSPPPPTTKVGITAKGGYQAECHWFLTGLDIPEKARMLEVQIRHLLRPHSARFSVLDFTVNGSVPDDPKTQNAATVDFRIFAQAPVESDLAPHRFARPCLDAIMSSYPGATPHLDLRTAFPKPIYEYYVTLLPQTSLNHIAHMPFNGQSMPIDPIHSMAEDQTTEPSTHDDTDTGTALSTVIPAHQYRNLSASPKSSNSATSASTPTSSPHSSTSPNSSTTTTPITPNSPPPHTTGSATDAAGAWAELPAQLGRTVLREVFGPWGRTMRGPLGWLAHARSGDKGPDCNVGFWVRRPGEYEWLRSLLTVERVKFLLGEEYKGGGEDGKKQGKGKDIERFEFEGLRAVHFLLRGHLDRGVGVTRSTDFLGKNCAEFLRSRWVDLPVRFLEGGKI